MARGYWSAVVVEAVGKDAYLNDVVCNLHQMGMELDRLTDRCVMFARDLATRLNEYADRCVERCPSSTTPLNYSSAADMQAAGAQFEALMAFFPSLLHTASGRTLKDLCEAVNAARAAAKAVAS